MAARPICLRIISIDESCDGKYGQIAVYPLNTPCNWPHVLDIVESGLDFCHVKTNYYRRLLKLLRGTT